MKGELEGQEKQSMFLVESTSIAIEIVCRCSVKVSGNGLKYPMPPMDRTLDHTVPVDWDALAGA